MRQFNKAKKVYKFIFGLVILASSSAAVMAQDRCGCDRQLQSANCGNDRICQERAMSRHHACMRQCYPQTGSPGTAR
jgi:hypothetical protein